MRSATFVSLLHRYKCSKINQKILVRILYLLSLQLTAGQAYRIGKRSGGIHAFCLRTLRYAYALKKIPFAAIPKNPG